jgi:hypothetical protein
LRLTEGIALALLTGTAYMAAFAFEAGWAEAFGYPVQLIDLQIVPALFFTLLSLSVLIFFWNAADPLMALLKPGANDHPVVRELRPGLAGLAIAFAFYAVNGFRGVPLLWWSIALLVGWVAFHLLFPLLAFRSVQGYVAKIAAVQEVTQQRHLRKLIADTGALVPSVFLCFLALFLSFTAGQSQATRCRSFFVIGQKPEWVVLRIYGSRAITAELVRKESGFRPRYRVFNVDQSETVLTPEALGPLTPLPAPVAPSVPVPVTPPAGPSRGAPGVP